MNEFQTVVLAVLPVFTIALTGLFIRRLNWLTAEADASLLRVLINVLVPCFFLDSVLGNPALDDIRNVTYPPIVGFVTVTAGILVAWWLRRLSGTRPGGEQRTFAFLTGTYNYGYIPIPLALSLFSRDTVGVLVVHNLGVEVALWTVGLMTLGGVTFKDSWRRLINPPLITIVLALSLNFSGLTPHVPEFLTTTFNLLGQCAIPMGIVLIGATIADLLPEFKPANSIRVMTVSCLLRLGLYPFLFLVLAKYGPFSTELKQVIVLQAAMPCAVFPIVMSKHYGGDTPTALRAVLATSAVAFITIPVWIRTGIAWVLE